MTGKKSSSNASTSHYSNNVSKNHAPSYITILDLTLNSTMLYVSPTVKDCIGYEPEELQGKSCYAILHPDEKDNLMKFTMDDMQGRNPPIARMFQLRVRHKDHTLFENGWVKMDCIVGSCYDSKIVVASPSNDDRRSFAWKSSAQEVVVFKDDGKIELEHWNETTPAYQVLHEQLNWEAALPPREPRFFLIINRFTIDYTILFASLASNNVIGMESDALIGKSFMDFVSPENRETVKKQLAYIKENQHIGRLNFVWNSDSRVNCQGVITSSCDGLVFVIRQLN